MKSSHESKVICSSLRHRKLELTQTQRSSTASVPLKRLELADLPHDIKIQILYWAPDVDSLLALANVCKGFEVAFASSPTPIVNRVTLRQLKSDGFDVWHPMLEVLHYLKYPPSLLGDWLGGYAEDESGVVLKSLYEVVRGRSKSRNLPSLEIGLYIS